MSKENRAFDTDTFGTGYGFESFPKRPIEMPPTWVLFVGLAFLLGALGFWVSFLGTRVVYMPITGN